MESSMAMIEVEANHRIKKAEHDATNHIKATQDELRRVQKELDTKTRTIAKMKKRKLGVAVTSPPAPVHVPAPDPALVPARVTEDSNGSSAMTTNSMQPAVSPAAATSNDKTSIQSKETKKSFTKSPSAKSSNQRVQKTQGRKKSVTPIFQCYDNVSNQKVAVHLLQHLDTISEKLLVKLKQRMKIREGDSNFSERNMDESKIRNLLHLFAFYKLEDSSTNENVPIHLFNNIHQWSSSYTTPTTEQQPSICILTIAKELISLVVNRGRELLKGDELNSNYHLESILLSLSTLYELCIINADVRISVRKWINDSFSRGKLVRNCHNRHTTSCMNTNTSSRVRGLSKMKMKRLDIATKHVKNIIPVRESNTDKSLYWDNGQCSLMCQNFMKCLSSLLIGTSISSTGTTIQIDRSLKCSKYDLDGSANSLESLKIQCATFLLMLTHDASQEGSNYNPSDERIWKVIFEYLFPAHDSSLASGSKDFFDVAITSIGERKQNSNINRQNFLRIMKDTNMEEANESMECERRKNDINKRIPSSLQLRLILFQLLYQIVRASKYVQAALFERKMNIRNPVFCDDVSLARRLYACVLDEIQLSLLPSLKEHIPAMSNDQMNEYHNMRNNQQLSLVWYMTRLLTKLCETKPGLTLMQTQMKVEGGIDFASGVAVFVDVLEFSVHALVQESRLNSKKLSSITTSCIAFFYQMLGYYHIKERRCVERLFVQVLSDSERLSNFQSICRTIVVSFPINSRRDEDSDHEEITRKMTKVILQELEDDVGSDL